MRGLDDQPDAGDALLRPVVQRQRQPAALALLDAQEPVGQPSALAFAQLGLDPKGLGEGEETRVVRGAHRCGGEHAQLRSLDGAEGRIGAAQHGQSAALQGGDGQRSDLDGAAVGVGEGRGEIGGADGVECGRTPGLPERCARDDGAAVVRAFEHEPAVGRHELQRLLGDALEQTALVELVGEPGRGRQQAVERIGLRAQLLAQRALGLDVALGPLTRAAGAQRERPEHAEGDRKQHVQDDLVDAHVRSIRACTLRHYSMIDSRRAIATACVRLSASSFARMCRT